MHHHPLHLSPPLHLSDLGPIFTAGFAWLLLDEKPPSVFPFCVTLSIAGVVLVTQPGTFTLGPGEGGSQQWYGLGVASALFGAVAAGLLPALTRKSKEAHWATVELWSAATSSFVFTPIALAVWLRMPETDGSGQTSRAEELQATVADFLGFGGLFALLLGISTLGYAGLGLQTFGYQREEAARASMMTYLEVGVGWSTASAQPGPHVHPIQIRGDRLLPLTDMATA